MVDIHHTLQGGTNELATALSMREQLENCKVALQLWLETPPESVVYGLRKWSCGTQACFGGHLATWKYFQDKYAIHPGPGSKAPVLRRVQNGELVSGANLGVAYLLFGDEDMFDPAGAHRYDHTILADSPSSLTDHKIVTNRLNQRIKEIEREIGKNEIATTN